VPNDVGRAAVGGVRDEAKLDVGADTEGVIEGLACGTAAGVAEEDDIPKLEGAGVSEPVAETAASGLDGTGATIGLEEAKEETCLDGADADGLAGAVVVKEPGVEPVIDLDAAGIVGARDGVEATTGADVT